MVNVRTKWVLYVLKGFLLSSQTIKPEKYILSKGHVKSSNIKFPYARKIRDQFVVVNRQPGQRDVPKCPEYIVVDMKKKEESGRKRKNSTVSTGQNEIYKTRSESREASARSWALFSSPNAPCYMRVKMSQCRHPECVLC